MARLKPRPFKKRLFSILFIPSVFSVERYLELRPRPDWARRWRGDSVKLACTLFLVGALS
jgi:hypothetical protein